MKSNLIAFCGYGGSGKDEAARPLIEAGYARRCFGDIIKAHLDPVIVQHMGFSAFTEDRGLKPRIRRTLESYGEDNYDAIMADFFASLPERCINTRLCRLREAKEWIARGGLIFEVRKPGLHPETEWARERMLELRRGEVIHSVIDNDSDVPALHRKIAEVFDLPQAFAA